MRAGVYHLVYGSEGRARYVEWRSKSSTEQHFLMGVCLGFWIDERGGGGGGGEGEEGGGRDCECLRPDSAFPPFRELGS